MDNIDNLTVGQTLYANYNFDGNESPSYSVKCFVTDCSSYRSYATGDNRKYVLSRVTKDSFSEVPLYPVINRHEKRCVLTEYETESLYKMLMKLNLEDSMDIISLDGNDYILDYSSFRPSELLNMEDGFNNIIEYIDVPFEDMGFTEQQAKTLEDMFLEIADIPKDFFTEVRNGHIRSEHETEVIDRVS